MTFRSKRLVAALTLCALVFTAIPLAAAPTASDIEGHWAKTAIEQLVNMGAVSGLPDGTFRPDLTVTRAEFVTMVNKSLGITPITGSTRFQDVKPEDWFAGQVEAAAANGYVTGNPDGTFSPYRPITREQAAAMLVRAFGFDQLATEAEQDAVLVSFVDADQVSAWAKADVATAVSLELMSGYTATTLAPQPADLSAAGWQQWENARTTEQREAVLKQLGSNGLITRAQTAAILVRALALKAAVEVTVFDEAGTYGPEDGSEIISGDVIIRAEDVTLQNLIITGDLTITENVGDGTVILQNVTVKGKTNVKGGGTNSVIFRDCTLHGTVTVEKVDGQIRIVAEGSTFVPKVVLQSGAILISKGDGSFEQILLPKDLDKNTEVVLTGNFAEVEIAAEKANVKVGEGSKVDNLVLTKNANGTQVDLDKKANVKTVTANAEIEITGKGSIARAEINTDGVTIEQKPDKTVLEPGVKANVGGKDVSEPKKSSGGGGGGGGSKRDRVSIDHIADISLEKGKTRTVTVTTSPTSATITAKASLSGIVTLDVKDKNITITGKKEGTTIITVTASRSGYNDGTKTFKVHVTADGEPEVPVSAISVTPKTMTLTVGATGTITVTVEPTNATNKKVNWTTSNADVATVANGVVTAKSVGTATITATPAADSTKNATCVVTVEAAAPITVESVSVVDGADGYTPVTIPKVEQVIRANITLSDGTVIGTYPVNENAEYKWYYKESTDTVLGTEGSYTVTSDNIGKTICVEVTVKGYEGKATWEASGKVAEETPVVVDKSALQAKVDAVADLVEADYTAETWGPFATALTAAQGVLANEAATQEDVDNALTALTTAFEALVDAEVLEAPADGLTELAIPGLTADNVKYLAFGLNNEAGTAQKAATLDEVKNFIDSKYGVTFNATAIKVEVGKLSIDGSILSKADWRKVKADGDSSIPYRMTVLITDKANKVAKIAMYEDGVAVIEDLQEPVAVPSTYSFSFVEPDKIVANQPATIDVTFANDEPAGDYGYDGVRFKFSVTGDGDAIFSAVDSEGNPYEATNEGYWGPSSGFTIGAKYDETTPWAVTFTQAGEYTITVSLIEAPDGEVVAGITDTFTVNVQAEEPEEPSIPELTVSGPSEEVAGDFENFEVTFAVEHDKDLAFLEIDHNLGKHGSLPSEDLELPEFKLYPNAANPWATDDMDDADARKQYAESQGLVATYDANEETWTLTFGNPVLDQIRNLTAEYTNNEFRIYSLVRDIEGVQSGSMYDGTYEITVITMQTASEPQPEVTFTFTGLDNVAVGTVDFSITTKVTNNGAIADNIPLRYKAVVTKDGSALADQVIKYPEATDDREDPSTWSSFTTDSNGTAYFGPSTGFTLTQLQALLSAGGVTTPFQADFAAGSYSVTVFLLDISGGGEVVLGSGTEEFTVTLEEGKAYIKRTGVIYDTIQEAVDAAEDGDTIRVAAGIYSEEVKVNTVNDVKSITILGVNADIVPSSNEVDGTILTGGLYIGTDASAAIQKNVAVKGITFNGGKGLLLGNIQTVTVENNKFINIEKTFNPGTTNVAAIAVIDPYVGGTITIKNNYIDGVQGVENGETGQGLGIYIRKPTKVIISGNHVEDTAHNTVLLSGAVTGANASITGNKLVNWDSDNDDTVGGRALRSAVAASEFVFTENCMVKQTWADNPVDPNFVKVTSLQSDAVVNIDKNYWASEAPNFNVILDDSGLSADDVKDYYSDETMKNLVDAVVQAALNAVNEASDANYYAEVRSALEGNAVILGIDVTEDSDYAKLLPDGRKDAVALDIFYNKPEGGYDLATLQKYFNGIVATRHKTQESLNTVTEAKGMWDEAGDNETKKAEAVNKLINLEFVTIMKDQFNNVDYTYHSRNPINEKLEVLNAIMDAYKELDANNKATKIETLLSEKLTDYVLGSASRPIREMGKLLGLEDDFVKKY